MRDFLKKEWLKWRKEKKLETFKVPTDINMVAKEAQQILKVQSI